MSSTDTWRPNKILAVVFALFFGPFAFLYINRLRLFFFYLALTIGYLFLSYGPLSAVLQNVSSNWQMFFWAFPVIYLVHVLSEVSDWDTSRPRGWYARWLPTLSFGAVLYCALLMVRVLFFEMFSTHGGAMLPTLKPGAQALVNKQGFAHYSVGGIALGKGEATVDPKAGELLAFTMPGTSQVYLFRVVGLPGDTVKYSRNQLSVKKSCAVTKEKCQQFETVTDIGEITGKSDDRLYTYVKESFGNIDYQVALTGQQSRKTFQIEIPEDQYFMMGDNRDHSRDGRHFGLIPRDNLIGRVEYIWQ